MPMNIAAHIPPKPFASDAYMKEGKQDSMIGILFNKATGTWRERPSNTWIAILVVVTVIITLLMPCSILAQDFEGSPRLESDLQKTKADLVQTRKDIAKAEAELNKTDSLVRAEAVRAALSEERQAKDRERREKENQDLEKRLRETQAKIAAERSVQSRQVNSVEEIKSRQKNLVLTLAAFCDSVALRIASGPPWDRETRLDRIKALKRDLETGNASVDEGFSRINAIIKEEIKTGDEIAVFNKPITRKNGEVVNAQVLKVGNQWVVYMDEEAKNFGILERKAAVSGSGNGSTAATWTWDWREDPGFTERNQIRTAMEVKSAKRPPQLVMLSLGIVPAGAETIKGVK